MAIPISESVISLVCRSLTECGAGNWYVRSDLSGLTDQRFRTGVDVSDLPVVIDREAESGFFVTGVIEDQLVVKHHLHLGIEPLDLDADRHWIGCRREIMVDIDDVFARDQTAHRDDLLADSIADRLAVDDDHVLVVAAVVA